MFILRPTIRMGFVVCAFVALNSIGYTYANKVKVNDSRDEGQQTRYMKEDQEVYNNNDESTNNYHFGGRPVLSKDFATKEMARQLTNDIDHKRLRKHKVTYDQYSAEMMGRTAAKSSKSPSTTTTGKSSKSALTSSPSISAQPSEYPSISSVPSFSTVPSKQPSESPSTSKVPSFQPSEVPSISGKPSNVPSFQPSEVPSISGKPSVSSEPSGEPSISRSPSASNSKSAKSPSASKSSKNR